MTGKSEKQRPVAKTVCNITPEIGGGYDKSPELSTHSSYQVNCDTYAEHIQ